MLLESFDFIFEDGEGEGAGVGEGADAGAGAGADAGAGDGTGANGAGATNGEAEWNGELENIQKESWYNEIPEPKRPVVLSGLQKKYTSWSKGYGAKMEETATLRKRLEVELAAKEREIAAREETWLAWDAGMENPVGVLTKQNEKLRKDLRDLAVRAEQERDSALKKAADDAAARISTAEQTAAEAKRAYDELSTSQKQLAESMSKTLADELVEHFETNLSDVYTHDQAFEMCANLIEKTEMSVDDAVDLVRAKFKLGVEAPPAKPKVEPKPLSQAQKAMTVGAKTGGTSAESNETYLERKARLRQEANDGPKLLHGD